MSRAQEPERVCPVCKGEHAIVLVRIRGRRRHNETVECPRCRGTGIAPPDEEGKL